MLACANLLEGGTCGYDKDRTGWKDTAYKESSGGLASSLYQDYLPPSIVVSLVLKHLHTL